MSPTRLTSARKKEKTNAGHRSQGWRYQRQTKLTVYRSLSGQDNYNELQALVRVLQIAKHGLHLVRPGGVLAETWLSNDRHTGVVGYALHLGGEVPASDKQTELYRNKREQNSGTWGEGVGGE